MNRPRILVGVDYSDTGDRVTARAEQLAIALNGELVLARVCEFPSPPTWLEQYSSIEAEERFEVLRQEWLDEEGELLDELYSEVRQRGTRASWELLEGQPADQLLEKADDVGARYIVIGGEVQNGMENLLGGVATRVVRRTRRRVLVVRNEAGTPTEGYRRVLVATDFTGASERLVGTALELSAPDATIDVLHCWGLPDAVAARALVHKSSGRLARDIREEIADGARQRGAGLLERLDGSTRQLVFLEREDRARRGILAQLGNEPYDLVVVGSHGARGVWRFSLGSVASSVVRRSPTSVLVAPVADRLE